jgi:para-aminobenzoate synthetase component 1
MTETPQTNNSQAVISSEFIQKACTWAQQFDTVCILDNNRISNALGLQEIEFALAVGCIDSFKGTGDGDWDEFKFFIDKHSGQTPVFGYLSYDLKNQLEDLNSNNKDEIGFDPLFFFAPLHIILIDQHGQLMVMSENGNEMLQHLLCGPK